MTENEAIKVLVKSNEHISMIPVNGIDTLCYSSQMVCALEMAEKALEEIQQYRTMEEKLNGISVKEVVDGFISAVEKETCEGYERGRILTNEDAEKWNALKAIGTIEEFKALKEKSTPKKPIDRVACKDGIITVGDVGTCPNCGHIVAEDMFVCEDCLQVLDWEGGE